MQYKYFYIRSSNWGKLSKKFFKSIILDIIEDITATKEELIYKYAIDKEFAANLISKSSDSHNMSFSFILCIIFRE